MIFLFPSSGAKAQPKPPVPFNPRWKTRYTRSTPLWDVAPPTMEVQPLEAGVSPTYSGLQGGACGGVGGETPTPVPV